MLQRYLDHMEVPGIDDAPVQYVEYEGTADPDLLHQALELLCARYPVLRGRVTHDGHGHLLYVSPDDPAEFIVAPGGHDTFVAEMGRAWDARRALARLTLVQGDGGGRSALRIDHSVVDGRSCSAMLLDLWRLYADLESGAAVEVAPPASLPAPPSELFKRHFGHEEFGGLAAEPLVDRAEVPADATVLQRHIRLSEDRTKRLCAAARARGTSVHALVSGAVVVAHRNFGSTATTPMPLGCLSSIDLRSWMTPQVGDTETTNFVGLHLAEVDVPLYGKPAVVGRAIKDQLAAALARRVLPAVDLPRFFAARADVRFEPRLSIVLVSNIGVLPSIAQPTGLRITDWQRILTTPSASGMIPGYGVYTYDDRLTIWSFYSSAFYTEYEVTQLGKRIAEQLDGIG
jgi:hypothetical protein